MNKSDLIGVVAEETGTTQAQAKKMVESFLTAVEKATTQGKRVTIAGFGTFSQTTRAAREGRNPQTGKTIKIAAKNVVKFKAGAELDGAVN
jgi:DNA-binding protein HU-beta